MIIQQPLMSTTGWIASKISYTHNGPFGYAPGGSWKDQYLFPIVWAITQIIVLEILGWIYVYGSRPFTRKRR
jgi:hypothetical protein